MSCAVNTPKVHTKPIMSVHLLGLPSTTEMLACTERQLVRVYPSGTRFDSSNYDPTLMWGCGVQIVSFNFQKPGVLS